MRRQLLPALRMLILMTVLTGVGYTAVITGIARTAFGYRAGGSLVLEGDEVVGSELLGQPSAGPEYFHPRPSAVGYDGSHSGGSNFGPNNPEQLAAVAQRVAAYREENGLSPDAAVPADAVTASASGLDPHISVANARIQAPRVAAARGISEARVLDLVAANTTPADWGFLSEPAVNVLLLNLALDSAVP